MNPPKGGSTPRHPGGNCSRLALRPLLLGTFEREARTRSASSTPQNGHLGSRGRASSEARRRGLPGCALGGRGQLTSTTDERPDNAAHARAARIGAELLDRPRPRRRARPSATRSTPMPRCSTCTATPTTTAPCSRASEPDALVAGLAAAIAVAARRIDLTAHKGIHPRVGAADVVPFVRFRARRSRAGPGRARAGRADRRARHPGARLRRARAAGGGRRSTGRGGTAGLQALIDAGTVVPLYGPATLHPTAGAVLLGVRGPLIAFNVDLRTDDVGGRPRGRRSGARARRRPARRAGARAAARRAPAGRRCR